MSHRQELPFGYTLTRARRKTLAIHVHPDGAVEVRAPLRMAEKRIRQFVAEKSGWITAKRAEALARQRERRQSVLGPGDTVTLLGREYRLETVGPGECPGLRGEKILLPEGAGKEETGQVLAEVCRGIAKDFFPARAAELARMWGFAFSGVSVTGARTRWGSCSGKNHLNFSLRLCWASPRGADYVILHELAHTREHNHSPRFWATVAEKMPDYRLREAELRELQKRLYLLDL